MLSHRSGLDLAVVRMLAPLVDSSVGPTPTANLLRELHTSRHTRLSLAYYDTVNSFRKRGQQSVGQF